MKLAFELVDGIKQIALLTVDGPPDPYKDQNKKVGKRFTFSACLSLRWDAIDLLWSSTSDLA